MPKENRLRKPSEFRRAYNEGERFKGRFMTAFIVPSETSFQRVGVTASRKAIGNSVKRNRAKRLLREAFRLSAEELKNLAGKYDWALNARKAILDEKIGPVLLELREIVSRVREWESNRGARNNVS